MNRNLYGDRDMQNKKYEYLILVVALCVCFIVMLIFMIHEKDYDELNKNYNSIVVSDKSESKILSLQVIEKNEFSFEMYNINRTFSIELSNGMIMVLPHEEYKIYEVGEFYEFEIIRTSTVSEYARPNRAIIYD